MVLGLSLSAQRMPTFLSDMTLEHSSERASEGLTSGLSRLAYEKDIALRCILPLFKAIGRPHSDRSTISYRFPSNQVLIVQMTFSLRTLRLTAPLPKHVILACQLCCRILGQTTDTLLVAGDFPEAKFACNYNTAQP